jgi:hypothetical protein
LDMVIHFPYIVRPFLKKKKLKILRMEHCKGSIGKKFS